jgi:hypothetical protein
MTSLGAANRAITANFRNTVNQVKAKFNSASTIDIRGCQAGSVISYLEAIRHFFGSSGNQPAVSAPRWFQSFPFNVTTLGTGFSNINTIINSGHGSTTAQYVRDSFDTWKGLIDFDPHYTFVSGLFASGASKMDFATLEWQVWRTGTSTTGIPVLRMEALRIDDIASLDLAETIERFRVIFDVATTSAPNPAERLQLKNLRPHLRTFKTIRTNVAAAAPSPTPDQLTQFFSQLSTVAGEIAGIFPPPASLPLVPSSSGFGDIQTSVSNIETHVNTVLDNHLNSLFSAIQGRVGHPNAQLHYYFMVGLPLLVQHRVGSHNEREFRLFIWGNSPVRDAAVKSWMKIQWAGSAAQTRAMNFHIDGHLTIQWNANGTYAGSTPGQAASVVQVVEQPANPSRAEINPLPGYQLQIRKSP